MDPATIQATIRETAKGLGTIPPTAAAPSTPATPAPPATPEGKPRGDDGKFTEDPNKKAMREVIKRQQERIKALEAKSSTPVVTPTTPTQDPDADLVASMSPETKAWWEKVGAKAVDARAKNQAEVALKPFERALANANETLAKQEAEAAWNANLNDWMAGKMADGIVVDERAMLTALDTVEGNGWRLGKSDADHFEAVFGMLKASNPAASAPIKTGEEAKKSEEAEAAARAAAAGVRPGGSVAPNPVEEYRKDNEALRTAGFTGDSNVTREVLRRRVRGLGVLPSESRGIENGG